MKISCLEGVLAEFFGKYGRTVSKYPILFVLWPLVMTLILATGCVWRMTVLRDSLALYTPLSGQSMVDMKQLKALFPINQTNIYYPERRIDHERTGYILITGGTRTGSDGNILQPIVFQEAAKLWENIRSLIVLDNGTIYKYESLCVQVHYAFGANCVQNPLLDLYVSEPLSITQLGYPTTKVGFVGGLIGGIETGNVSNKLIGAKAIMLPYQLKHANKLEDKRAAEWEIALSEFLETFKSDILSVSWWTSETLAVEADRDTKKLITLTGPLFMVVTTFTVISCFVGSWVRSKPWLGLAGVLSACSAIVSAIGLLSYAGQELTSVAYFMPYIVFSIGVDNVFILLAAWRKTSIYLPVSERMSQSFKEAGVSITVTSLTDALSFGIGVSTDFTSVKIFCKYAAVAILFVYFYQLTLFAGFMVLTGRREAAERNCITCIAPKTTNVDTSDESREVDNATGVIDTCLSRFFRTTFTNFITRPLVKGCVIITFFVYLAVAAWGCTKIKIGLEVKDLLPKKSFARETLSQQQMYFTDYGDYLHLWFTNLTSELDYSVEFWELIEYEVDRFEDTPYSELSDSWLRVFRVYVKQRGINLQPHNFITLLKDHFLNDTRYAKYKSDIVFNEILTRLYATRFPIRLINTGLENQSASMDYFRDLASKSLLNAHVFHEFFLFADQYSSILPATLSNVGFASAAVILVSLLLIPKPLCAIWVSLTIVSINLGIFGYMSLWGVKLDYVSMVTIVMSIGFCVDYSAHIAYHFSKDRGLSSVERVRDSFYAVGAPIVQSAISTLLGILILLAVDNYMYMSFLKTVFLVLILGLFHGLVVLPVLLTLFYCESPKFIESNLAALTSTITSSSRRHRVKPTKFDSKSVSGFHDNKLAGKLNTPQPFFVGGFPHNARTNGDVMSFPYHVRAVHQIQHEYPSLEAETIGHHYYTLQARPALPNPEMWDARQQVLFQQQNVLNRSLPSLATDGVKSNQNDAQIITGNEGVFFAQIPPQPILPTARKKSDSKGAHFRGSRNDELDPRRRNSPTQNERDKFDRDIQTRGIYLL